MLNTQETKHIASLRARGHDERADTVQEFYETRAKIGDAAFCVAKVDEYMALTDMNEKMAMVRKYKDHLSFGIKIKQGRGESV